MKFRGIASAVLFGFACMCAAQASATDSQPEAIDSTEPIATLILPPAQTAASKDSMSVEELMTRIRLRVYRNVGPGQYPDIEELVWRMRGNKFLVENYKGYIYPGSQKPHNKVSVSYEGEIALARAGENYQLDFTLQRRNDSAQPNMLTGKPKYEVSFSPADVAKNLNKADLLWSAEVDSEFNADSIRANFVRLARREAVQGISRDPLTGKQSNERFWVRLTGKEIPIALEIYPYRNGSKVVASGIIPGNLTGRTVDFAATAEALRREIERIIKA